VTPESIEDRAARVYGLFKRARLDAAGKGWEHWNLEIFGFLCCAYFFLVAIFLEPELWLQEWLPAPFNRPIPDFIALLLLPILPFNGWLISRFLSIKTPEIGLPRWLLIIRFIVASLPVCNLLIIPLWRSISEGRQGKLLQASRTSRLILALDLTRERDHLPIKLRFRWLYRSGFFMIWLAAGVLPLLIWARWLANATIFDLCREESIFAVAAALHVGMFISMACFARPIIRKQYTTRRRRILLYTLLILFLFGLPGALLAYFFFAFFIETSREPLSSHAFDRRSAIDRLPLWTSLQRMLRQQWQGISWSRQWQRPSTLNHVKRMNPADMKVIGFYRLKALFLPLESGAFLATLSSLAIWSPHLTSPLSAAIRWMTYTAISLALLGLAVHIVGLLANCLRISLMDPLSRNAYGRYLFLTQTAFLAGTQGAFLVMGDQIPEFGVLLGMSSVLCTLILAVSLILSMGQLQDRPGLAIWAFLFLSIGVLGAFIGLKGQDDSRPIVHTLKTLAILSPLWGFGLFLALGGWLLRPFSWRHASDQRLPLRFRVALTVMIATSVLPLGGLALPFWIYARHRIWPRYEPLLYKLHGEGHAP
jgi:hypothetical protein